MAGLVYACGQPGILYRLRLEGDLLGTDPCRLKEIFNTPHYIDRRVDQSVVEIVIARIVAAIRETGSIDTYSAELVDVLDSCLNHPMSVLNSEGEYVDSPHCKIASDLLSSLFLAVGSSNQELVRNTTSYISLAAIHNGKALSHYALQIISYIINGNHSLLRVLPQVYPDNREPFHAHIPQLLSLLTPYLTQFDHYLLSPSTCTAVLNIYMSLISQGRAHTLAPFLPTLSKACQQPAFNGNLATIYKIMGNIGRVSLPLATEVLDELVRSAQHTDDEQLLSSILTEIEGVGEAWPSALRLHIDILRAVGKGYNKRVIDRILALVGNSTHPSMNGDVTVISIANGEKNSSDSLIAKTYSRVPGGTVMRALNAVHFSGPRTIFPVCESPADNSALELDRNTHSLAMQYQNRSSGSLPRRAGQGSASQSLQGMRTTSENADSRDLSQSSVTASSITAFTQTHPKTQTLPAGFAPNPQIQIGKDGRVRPLVGSRRAANWAAGYETTFPANSGPVTTTKMHALSEEEERQWAQLERPVFCSFVAIEHLMASGRVQENIERFVGSKIEVASSPENAWPVELLPAFQKIHLGRIALSGSKHRMIVHFSCQVHSSYCAFHDDYMFAFKTKFAPVWLHLMFLQMQSSSIENGCGVVSQSSSQFLTLARCWQCLPSRITREQAFVTLVTSAFPTVKEQDKLFKELEDTSFFDCFSLDGPSNRWSCFSCSHPERVKWFVEDGGSQRVLEGQLKEKKGRWRFLRRWHTKYFTLSSAALTCSSEMASESNAIVPAIDLRSIRSIRSLSRGRKSRKSLRKAFEIFTSDNTSVVLKATDEKKAEEWLQYLQIAVAHARRDVS
ncbi:unnamed protein product [Nippostrongylus brasiliensis]|uniref:Protein melted homolog (inferred by orthology to a C. elegans protein) n=1 Tax=Nippostrongylus brasiliensis TaxID=27835 RepID=A0A158QZ51_NIPBR|nr:unnamed protein product [Nippostrongylus brasiliensis]